MCEEWSERSEEEEAYVMTKGTNVQSKRWEVSRFLFNNSLGFRIICPTFH